MLEMYSELAGERVPDQAQWNRIRHRHFVEAFHHWERVIKDEAKDVKEIYDDVQTYIRVSIWVVRGVWVAVIADVLTAGGLVPLMIMALRGIANGAVAIGKSKVGTAGAAGLVTMTILDDDFRKEVLEFLRDHGSFISAPAGFAWGSAPRMARFGQLLGIIVASVAISKGIVKEAKWKDRWAPGIGKAYKIIPKHLLVSQLQVNPLLPAIKLALFHYVQLVEQVILDSRQSFAELEQKIEDILLGDPKYRDIIEPDEGLTWPKLLEIVQVVEKMVADWLKRLAQVPGLSDRIGEIAERLEHLAPDRMPTIEDIRDGKMEETEWLREAFMFIILSHLHGGLNYVSRALHEMVQPVNPKASTPVSVSLLLQTLGFNLQDAEAQELLDRNFDQVFEEQAT
jgi:hypothetical protein